MTVRRESVRLTLEDDFTSRMARAAAATALLKRNLDDVDGTSLRRTGEDVDLFDRRLRGASNGIDSFSGRLGLLAQTAGALGPALAPIGAVGVAGAAALTAQLGFASLGMASVMTAAQGVGDALEAVNAAALEPTADNLEKAREAMSSLAPEAQAFVSRIEELRPALLDIRDASAAGLFPGVTSSLDHFERIAPRVATLFNEISQTMGSLTLDGSKALAGPEWAGFISFLTREGPPALDALARSVGNVVQGMAHLAQAMTPLNRDFSTWLLDSSRAFEEWADGVGQTREFEEFVAYVRENGPKVADAAVAIANAIVQIAEAAAPLGGPVLEVITQLANAVAALADSPLGTPIMTAVTAMSALSLATKAATAATLQLKAAQTSLGFGGAGAGGAAGRGGAAALLGAHPAVAAIAAVAIGVENSVGNIKAALSGDMGAGEFLSRTLFPVINTLELLGINVDDVKERLEDFWFGADDPFLAATAANATYAAGLVHVGSAAELTRGQIRGLVGAMEEQKAAALGAFNAETSYREALKAAGEQAKKNNAGIKGSSEAALANRRALGQLAAAWNGLSDRTRNNAERQREARRSFIETAQAMGVSEKAARDLARRVLEIPDKATIKAELQGAQTVRQTLAQLRADLRNPIVQDVIVRYKGRDYTYQEPKYTDNGLNDLLNPRSVTPTTPRTTAPADPLQRLAPADPRLVDRLGLPLALTRELTRADMVLAAGGHVGSYMEAVA